MFLSLEPRDVDGLESLCDRLTDAGGELLSVSALLPEGTDLNHWRLTIGREARFVVVVGFARTLRITTFAPGSGGPNGTAVIGGYSHNGSVRWLTFPLSV